MARSRLARELYVYMNNLQVGMLIQLPAGNLKFSYASEWLNWQHARPLSLSMPLTEIPYNGEIVYNFFDNLLPDSESIRQRIQVRFGSKTDKCFDLLSYIGADCVGAIQLLSDIQKKDNPKIQSTPVSDKEIAKILKQYQTAPLGMKDNSNFRISLAGAQEKTALLWYKNGWHIPEGPTPTTHIIKLPIGFIQHSHIDLTDSVDNEWLCLQILKAYNLAVCEATIIQFEDIKTLAVKRFDRQWQDKKWILRLPQEDMCQALGFSSALKYESDGGPGIPQIMKLLEGAREAKSDRERFMKSAFIFWLLGAIDGHAKNFSIMLESGGSYTLSPLYDVMSAYPIAAKRQLEWQDLKLAMAVKGKNRHYIWSKILPRHWLATADACQFPQEQMVNIMQDAFSNLEEVILSVTAKLPAEFPTQISQSIFAGMRQIKNRFTTFE